jgi:glucuronate isomerase
MDHNFTQQLFDPQTRKALEQYHKKLRRGKTPTLQEQNNYTQLLVKLLLKDQKEAATVTPE